MLYLTERSDVTTQLIVYDTFVNRYNYTVAARIHNKSRSPVVSCIIDIDEYEACVLTLRGISLFKVIKVSQSFATLSNFELKVEVADIDALMHWWDERFGL